MKISHLDHVALRFPADRIDRLVEFYDDKLGFDVEGLDEYERGERSIFSFRLTDQSVLHARPTDDFEPPTGTNYAHLAVVFDEPIERIRSRVDDADIEIDRTGEPGGATGRGPAVYVNDPFGYIVELKESPALSD